MWREENAASCQSSSMAKTAVGCGWESWVNVGGIRLEVGRVCDYKRVIDVIDWWACSREVLNERMIRSQ